MPWGHWFQWIYYNLTGSPKNFRYSEATAKLVVNMGFGCGCLANKIKVNNTKSDDMRHVMTARDIWHAKAYVSNVTSILKSSIHKSHSSEFCNLAASLWNPAIKQSTLHQGPPDYNQKHHGGPGGIKQDYDNTKQLWRKNTKSRKIILLSPLYNVVH